MLIKYNHTSACFEIKTIYRWYVSARRPVQLESGRSCTDMVSSTKALHWTLRDLTETPHVALHGPQGDVMKLNTTHTHALTAVRINFTYQLVYVSHNYLCKQLPFSFRQLHFYESRSLAVSALNPSIHCYHSHISLSVFLPAIYVDIEGYIGWCVG